MPPKPAPTLNPQGLPEGYALRPEWEVSPREVKAMRERGDNFLLLDCRTPGEFQVARIEGSKLVPLQQIAQHLPELDEHLNHKIIVTCHHGVRSLQMASILRQQGFKDVKSMAGGIDLWSLDIDPKVPRY